MSEQNCPYCGFGPFLMKKDKMKHEMNCKKNPNNLDSRDFYRPGFDALLKKIQDKEGKKNKGEN